MTDRRRQTGFTLIELAIVLFVITLVMAGFMTPLTQQVNERQARDSRTQLQEISTALLGYALSHRDASQHPYLPCPDRRAAQPGHGTGNDGLEDRTPEGACAVTVGNLPWASLGMVGLDAWGNRISYAVSPAYAHSRAGITLAAVPPASLRICLDRECRTTVAAAAILLSHGRNGLGAVNAGGRSNLPAASADERENSDADAAFVSRAPAAADRPGGEFDDLLVWLTPDYLIGRLCGPDLPC